MESFVANLVGNYPNTVPLFPKWTSKGVERLLVDCDQLLAAHQGIGAARPAPDDAQASELRAKLREQTTVLQRTIEDFIRIDWKG